MHLNCRQNEANLQLSILCNASAFDRQRHCNPSSTFFDTSFPPSRLLILMPAVKCRRLRFISPWSGVPYPRHGALSIDLGMMGWSTAHVGHGTTPLYTCWHLSSFTSAVDDDDDDESPKFKGRTCMLEFELSRPWCMWMEGVVDSVIIGMKYWCVEHDASPLNNQQWKGWLGGFDLATAELWATSLTIFGFRMRSGYRFGW